MKIESFHWIIDANHDGSISLAEIWHTLQWLYQIPGNLVIDALGHIPVTAELFHIHASDQAGYYILNNCFSAAFSLFFWLFVLFSLSNLKAYVQCMLQYRQAHHTQ